MTPPRPAAVRAHFKAAEDGSTDPRAISPSEAATLYDTDEVRLEDLELRVWQGIDLPQLHLRLIDVRWSDDKLMVSCTYERPTGVKMSGCAYWMDQGLLAIDPQFYFARLDRVPRWK